MDVVILIRISAAAVLLSAALGKSAKFNLFVTTLATLGIPHWLLGISGVSMIFLEFVTALALLTGYLLLAGIAMMFFAAVVAASAIVAIRRSLHVPCACFGFSSHPLGARNIAIAMMFFLVSLPLMASNDSAPLHHLVRGEPLWGYVALSAATLLVVRWVLTAHVVARLAKERHASEFHVDAPTLRMPQEG